MFSITNKSRPASRQINHLGRAAFLIASITASAAALGDVALSEAEIINKLSSVDMSGYRLTHEESKEKLKGAKWSTAERIHIEFDDNWFEPELIELKVDQPYRLTLSNIGYEQHDIIGEEFFSSLLVKRIRNKGITIEAFHLERILIPAKAELELWVIPLWTSEFEFACTIPGHLEDGMIGTIRIVE